MNGTHMNGSRLVGTRSDNNVTVSGIGMIGATMPADLGDGTIIDVNIAAVEEGADIDYVTVTYNNGGTTTNVCGPGMKAILLEGVWNYATATHTPDSEKVTVACEGAALSKCAEWGYMPWQDHTECVGQTCTTVSGRALHEACTRMVRADYCGNGVSHTRDGTLIDVYDNGWNMDVTPDSGLTLEAEWSPDGAVCVKHSRWTKLDGSDPDRDYVLANCNAKWQPTTCGDSSSTFTTTTGNLAVPLDDRAILRNASALTNKD
jgi:hypothetical protein